MLVWEPALSISDAGCRALALSISDARVEVGAWLSGCWVLRAGSEHLGCRVWEVAFSISGAGCEALVLSIWMLVREPTLSTSDAVVRLC